MGYAPLWEIMEGMLSNGALAVKEEGLLIVAYVHGLRLGELERAQEAFDEIAGISAQLATIVSTDPKAVQAPVRAAILCGYPGSARRRGITTVEAIGRGLS